MKYLFIDVDVIMKSINDIFFGLLWWLLSSPDKMATKAKTKHLLIKSPGVVKHIP